MKTALKAAALGSLLAGFLWLAGWAYWHFTIVGAIAALERGAAPAPAGSVPPYRLPPEPMAELKRAGSRALPYLVESLDPNRAPVFLTAVSGLLCREAILGAEGPPPLTLGDDPAERASKCEAIRRAWAAGPAAAHRAWRWWRSTPLD